MFSRTVLQSSLAALLCLAVIAVAQPVAAQYDASPEELAREAARLATPKLDDAPNGLLKNPEGFVKVVEAPGVGEAEANAVVDLRKMPVSDIPVELLDHPRTHIQGELDHVGFSSSTTPPSENPEVRDPQSVLFEPETEGTRGTAGTSVTNWSARGYSGWIPPDTQLAVGPEYIVEAVNSGFMVYTKTGRETRAYTSFEGFVNLPSPWDGFCYDPRVVYDSYSDRFLMMIMGLDETYLTSYFWLMTSDDPNGSWNVHRFNASSGAAGSEQWLDYAAIGVDNWGVYVTGNYFEFGGGYQRTQLWSITPALMDGTSTRHYYWSDLEWPSGSNAKTVQPAMPQTTNSAGHTFYVNSWGGSGSELLLWTQSGKRWPESTDPDPANLATVVIPSKTYYSMYNNVDQPGSGWDIDGGDASVRNAYYTSGGVGITLALNWDGNRAYSEIYLAVLDIDGTMEYDVAIWNADLHMNYPALTMQPTAHTSADVGLTFSMTEPGSPTGFIGAAGFGWDPTTSTSTHFSWQQIGLGTYSRWDGDYVGDGRNRWGDYSGAAWDHTCSNAWFAAEYATASNNWDTQIFARTLGTYDPCEYYHITAPNGGESITAGSNYNITWDRMNIPAGDTVYLEYWNGSSWVSIDTVSTTASSYSWSVPNVNLGSARVQIRNTGTGANRSDTSDGTFTIVGLPDLVPSLLSPAASYDVGGTYSVYNSVRNNGVAAAGGFDVDLRLSTNTICSVADTFVGTRRISSLSAGAWNTVSTTINIPPGMTPGAYSLCQLIDTDYEVTEFVESNNSTYEPVTIIDASIFADGFEGGNTTAWDISLP